MVSKTATLAVTALASAVGVLAHGHVSNIVVNGIYYEGYDPTSFPYESDPPVVVGWTADDTDNGFISPDAYQTPDVICHKNATPAGGHATVPAGASILLQWTPWPDSHLGPVVDYLANCNGLCEDVDKTTLEFFKLDGIGYLSGADPGTWATTTLIAENSSWVVQIPEDLAAGNYVLRHEIIALHAAGSLDGAQNYMQCVNLEVTGTGSLAPSGVLGTDLYQETDPGILYNLYTSPEPPYTIPGPALVSGLPSSVDQVSSTWTGSSGPTIPGGAAPTTSSAGVTKPSSSSVATSTASKPTTLSTSAVTTAPPSTGTQSLYGQCGGSGYTGPTLCATPAACSTLNPYYAQCVD